MKEKTGRPDTCQSLLATEIGVGGGSGGGADGPRLGEPLDELGPHGRVAEEQLQESSDHRHLGGVRARWLRVGRRIGSVAGEAADLQVDVLVLGHEALLHLDLRPANGEQI